MAARSQLAVILHADVVGSTSLVQLDERVAHERIRDAFRHSSDAVAAALAMQAENAGRNEPLTDEVKPLVRVGIALGEVVIADDTVTGPGVVLAQRFEQLAQPGGVCIQGAIHESVPRRFPFHYRDLGEQSLKGFEEPVRAFTAQLQANADIPPPEPVAPTREKRFKRAWPAALIVALLILVGGLTAWLQPWHAAPTLAEQSLLLADNALARRLRAKQFFNPEAADVDHQFRGDQVAEAVAARGQIP